MLRTFGFVGEMLYGTFVTYLEMQKNNISYRPILYAEYTKKPEKLFTAIFNHITDNEFSNHNCISYPKMSFTTNSTCEQVIELPGFYLVQLDT